MHIMFAILIPFIGTTLGSACVFFLKNGIKDSVQRALLGFASGVMIAASVWSLLIPAMNQSEHMGKFSFVPAAVGLLAGVSFLFILDQLTPHLHFNQDEPEGPKSELSKTSMLVLAVTLHNIPEGMAIGVIFAGLINGNGDITAASALALAIGIAIQNFPEGAIISLPLRTQGNSKKKAFCYGALSGIVEPIAAGITILIAGSISTALPYLLAFAAGAMIYVVIEELIPEGTEGNKADICTFGFAFGFTLMMILDVALG